eukprot:TRINITY_DN7936_c0_g1_i3.p1 TRINITY_DN7936_c0_g1~~TRINITY_DN7936_c0_g1_i3.p1  ORF type:complete len:437 (+),score=101.10 TRINITY_DN7936_c0_g1_i3:80-1312(+)
MAAAAAAAAAALGGALAAVGGAVVAAAGAVQLAAFTWDGNSIAECAELASRRPLRACSVGRESSLDHHYATVSGPGGAVRCAGANSEGQLGSRDAAGRGPLGPTDPPLAAISVGCGENFTIALHSDGAMSSWGTDIFGAVGRGGDSSPAVIDGVPPVAVLGVGWNFVIAVTHSGHAYGWGAQHHGQLALGHAARPSFSPQRLPALCGRGLRRLACAYASVVAETAAGLLWWGWDLEQSQLLPAELSCAAARFPLRGLAHFGFAVVAADGAGAVWGGSIRHGGRAPLRRIGLAGERAVAAAAAQYLAVVLSEEGRLYDVEPGYDCHQDFCREIRSRHPQLPLGLVPHGGASSQHVVLVPDHCSGKARLRLFARIAARLELPADPLRASLTMYVVDRVYVHGNDADPFGIWL